MALKGRKVRKIDNDKEKNENILFIYDDDDEQMEDEIMYSRCYMQRGGRRRGGEVMHRFIIERNCRKIGV